MYICFCVLVVYLYQWPEAYGVSVLAQRYLETGDIDTPIARRRCGCVACMLVRVVMVNRERRKAALCLRRETTLLQTTPGSISISF